MSQHDDEGAGFFRRNRGLTIAGIAGLAVLSAGGAYLVNQGQAGTPGDVAAVAPVTTVAATTAPPSAPESPSVSATPSSPAPATTSSSARATATATASPSATKTDTREGEQRVKAARDEAAKDGISLKRPLTASAQPRDTSSRTEETRTLPSGGTMRVITGRYDLSGGRELAWAGDKGQEVDGAHCTQNFTFSAGSAPAVRPTMLLCWRTSAKRSVVVLTVEKSGPPSMAKSAAVIEQSWRKLG
ncbi:hypothetical protein [Paractinoplanes lichenicola]|uniref:Uncharacterized protein n=1 Tax=Paractinoplanes lichenicola TaxID=2802976 RepID=A0ABS1VJ41_9ACTN|nr:hypothetical protein [Actinoplanes lichenicola]MBL7254310.1 hypothetical protein [Actinoplanes lichenicola]